MVFDELDGLIRQQVERHRIPGLAIALVRGGETVWARGYGVADLDAKEPVTPSTVFSIQSVTKPIVATALLQWHERGAFALDDAINEYLGGVRLQNEWEATNPVTFRHLLTHSSGLPVGSGGPVPQRDGRTPSVQEFIASLRTTQPPGQEIIYSSPGYVVLGYALERFAGARWHQYLAEHLLEPLDMRSTAVGGLPEGAPAARGYFFSEIEQEHHPVQYEFDTFAESPAGSIMSTVEDLANFLIAHMNGGAFHGRRVLGEETVALMHGLHARAGATPTGMGLGFRVARIAGRRAVCHGGDGSGWKAFAAACPDETAGVALLINLGGAHSDTPGTVIGTAALRLLLGEEVEPALEWIAGVGMSIGGRYRSNFWGIEIDVREDGDVPVAVALSGPLLDQEQEACRLEPLSEGRFLAHGGFFAGWELSFQRGDDGRAASFAGGLYPWRFDRRGEAGRPFVEVDQRASLSGRWEGVVSAPYGPVSMTLAIENNSSATVTALSAMAAHIEEFRAQHGRVEGAFHASAAGIGEFRVFLRLAASIEGTLVGRAYARGDFGEVAMPAELERKR